MSLNTLTLLSKTLRNSQPSRDFRESHSIWKSDNCEIFFTEIHEQVYRVPIKFDNPVFSNVLNGNKKIQIDENQIVDFDKNQTLILPYNSRIYIDFPTSALNQPTQCTSIVINPDYINSKTQLLNETSPTLDSEWKLNFQAFSLLENPKINSLFQSITLELLGTKKAIHSTWEDTQLNKLLMRVMQQQNRNISSSNNKKTPTLIQSLITFIKENPEKTGSLDQLCNQACMSPSTLYRYFKRELGISPIEFIIQQKLSKAKIIMSSPFISIKEVSYLSGFEDSNYFIRLFKKHEGITPKQYQQLFSRGG